MWRYRLDRVRRSFEVKVLRPHQWSRARFRRCCAGVNGERWSGCPPRWASAPAVGGVYAATKHRRGPGLGDEGGSWNRAAFQVATINPGPVTGPDKRQRSRGDVPVVESRRPALLQRSGCKRLLDTQLRRRGGRGFLGRRDVEVIKAEHHPSRTVRPRRPAFKQDKISSSQVWAGAAELVGHDGRARSCSDRLHPGHLTVSRARVAPGRPRAA